MVVFLVVDVSVAPRVVMWTQRITNVCLAPKVIIILLVLFSSFTVNHVRHLTEPKLSVRHTWLNMGLVNQGFQ